MANVSKPTLGSLDGADGDQDGGVPGLTDPGSDIPPLSMSLADTAPWLGDDGWSDALGFNPPTFSPPTFSPPTFSPPVFSPPTFSPPPPISPPSPPPPPPVGPPVPPPLEPPSPSAFSITILWDPSVNSAPAGFGDDVLAAVQYLESEFSDPVNINIAVGYGEVNGEPLAPGDLGESYTYYNSESYTALRGAVASDAKTSTDASVLASLPVNNPINGADYLVSDAQSKALGLSAAYSLGLDGAVGFQTASNFTYGDTANGGAVAPNTYDFFATAVHEITEVMGRDMFVGAGRNYTLMDLLHYSSPGVRDLVQTTPGYFSSNGGVTNQGELNTIVGGDPGDWASSMTNDPFDAFATPGAADPVSADDLTLVDAIGWNSPSGSGTSLLTAPTSVSVTPETQNLALAQGRFGLAGGSTLATVAQAGGIGDDQYSYALSGTDAASFSLVTQGDEPVLRVGTAGVPGAPEGSLYTLTVTTTDETAAGNPSAAEPINVVIGDHGDDVIDLASMAGISTSAPTFIYGLGGNVTIDGTGMTGTLYFDGGAGADTMTGGGGVNVYEYGGAADSTGSAMDVITNFNASVDLIDLTGIISPIGTVAALDPSATQIAAGSIGWLTSAGNTFVYVNTGNQAEALVAANMKVELQGSVVLTSGNFSHL